MPFLFYTVCKYTLAYAERLRKRFYIVRSETITPLGTKWQPDRVIIIEFETREQLDACFSSREYRSIASLREQSVDSRAIIVEG